MPLLSKAGRALAVATGTAALALTAAPPAFAQDAGVSSTFEFVEVPRDHYAVDPATAMVEMEQDGRISVDNTDQLADGDVLRVRFTIITWGVTVDPDARSDQDCQGDPEAPSVTCSLTVDGDTDFGTELPFELVLSIEESYLMDGAYVDYRIETMVNGETVVSEDLEFVVGDLAFDFPEPSGIGYLQDTYEIEYLYEQYTLTGAVPGAALTGKPYYSVKQKAEFDSASEYAATVLWFQHSTDAWAWSNNGETIVTGAVEVVADYDNCVRDDLQVVCVLPGFDPTVGSNYVPREDTPLLYVVHQEVTEVDFAVPDERADKAQYGAITIDQEDLDRLLEYGVDLEGDDQFSLVETDREPGMGMLPYWAEVDFSAAGGSGGGELPQTGSSTTAVLASAFGAVAVGAAALVVSRRRRSAERRA